MSVLSLLLLNVSCPLRHYAGFYITNESGGFQKQGEEFLCGGFQKQSGIPVWLLLLKLQH